MAPKLKRFTGIKLLRSEGRAHRVAIRDQCRETREKLRADAKRRREALRDALRVERIALSGSCSVRLADARARTNEAIENARRTAMDLEKLRIVTRSPKQQHAAERARLRGAESILESDDEVRRNLTPDLARIWERVKHRKGMRKTPRRTRTEAFLEWVHDNSATVQRMLDAMSSKLPEEETEEEYRERTRPRSRYIAPAGSEDVPF